MRRYWVAIFVPKERNRLTDQDYDMVEADSVRKLLGKLSRMKPCAWVETEHVILMRRSDAVKKGLKPIDRGVSIRELKEKEGRLRCLNC